MVAYSNVDSLRDISDPNLGCLFDDLFQGHEIAFVAAWTSRCRLLPGFWGADI